MNTNSYKKFFIKKGDIVGISGAGGKTSLMFSLAKSLSSLGKVLISTTTKIFVPNESEYEKMWFTENSFISYGAFKNIDVIGAKIENGKIIAPTFQEIKKLKDNYDFILLEIDGSKQKKIKFWNEYEPNVPSFLTKIIAVFNIESFNLSLIEENIHRFEIFQKYFSNYIGNKMDLNFFKLYFEKSDYFKNFEGEKIFFINGIDGDDFLEKFNISLEIADFLAKKEIKVVLGSISNNEFIIFFSTDAIILASGYSKRLGKDKLKLLYRGTSLLEWKIKELSKINFSSIIVVGKDEWSKNIAKNYDVNYIYNPNSILGQSESVKLGIIHSKGEGICFFPTDQPFLTKTTILKLFYNFMKSNLITYPILNENLSSPVFFPKYIKNDFLTLEGDEGGKKIIQKYNSTSIEFFNKDEFADIDTIEDLKLLK